MVTVPGEYDFAWTEVNNNCSSTDVIRVVFHLAPETDAGPDATICRGGNIRLQAQGTGAFSWSPANLLNNPAIPDPVATPSVTTVFTVTLTDQWGCRNTDRVTVTVRERPVADAGPDQTLDLVFEAELDAAALNNNETGEWEILAGTGVFSNSNSNITMVTELSMGENSILWSVTNGVCPGSTDTVMITINDLILQTLITPNLDGNNDFFEIKGLGGMGKTAFIVFNRWGARVFENENYDNLWDGVDFNGKPLPDDTYFYILKSEKIKTIKGFFVIKH
jgi:gliding motility-associated-like protein